MLFRSAKIEEIDVTGRRREADLSGALQNEDPDEDKDEDVKPDPKAERAAAEAAAAQKDYQLIRAIDVLRGIAIYRQSTTEQK